MANPTKVVIDCSTNVAEIVEMTDEEIAASKAVSDQITAEWEQQKAEREAKDAARQSGIAKLLALGLTEDEANALVK